MSKKKESDADYLFKGSPEHVKGLHRAAKKSLRAAKRRDWADKNLKKDSHASE